jgi:hypothetical protein
MHGVERMVTVWRLSAYAPMISFHRAVLVLYRVWYFSGGI